MGTKRVRGSQMSQKELCKRAQMVGENANRWMSAETAKDATLAARDIRAGIGGWNVKAWFLTPSAFQAAQKKAEAAHAKKAAKAAKASGRFVVVGKKAHAVK